MIYVHQFIWYIDDRNNILYDFQSSPPALLPKGRTNDLDAILDCINRADKFISIDVTKYRPLRMRTAKLKYVSTYQWHIFNLYIETK